VSRAPVNKGGFMSLIISQNDKSKKLKCKNCKSENIDILDKEIRPAIGATFRSLSVICNDCSKPSKYIWASDVTLTVSD
jgi:RNase P subunit RPR2